MQSISSIPNLLLFLLFFLAISIGWFLGRRNVNATKNKNKSSLTSEYFQGLNYLLNDQTERATDTFIKILESNPDAIESQIALGNIFRHKGEVNKAIRLHQDIIAKPTISSSQRSIALLALAQDYMSAGLHDRAERIFLEIYQTGEFKSTTLEFLHQLYQRQKDWIKAISVAEKLEHHTDSNMKSNIAFYYCEMAEKVLSNSNFDLARYYTKCALNNDKNAVRASIIEGRIEKARGNFSDAIKAFTRVADQDPDFLSEVLDDLKICHDQLNSLPQYVTFLKQSLVNHPSNPIIFAFAEIINNKQGSKDAEIFLLNQLRQKPSLKGLHKLIKHHITHKDGKAKQDILILDDFMSALLKDKPEYSCSNCGFAAMSLSWQCPSCESWGKMRSESDF